MRSAVISTQEKVCKLIAELKFDLANVERQEKLKVISKEEAASIRKSLQQSIEDLRKVPCD
jgi:adenylosuccinate lyase